MARKKKPFRIEGGEKSERLDIRIKAALREQLEEFCQKHQMKLTDAVTRALEKFIASDQGMEK